VYFNLKQAGYSIDKVITVGTSDALVLRAADRYLARLFQDPSVAVEYEPIHVPAQDLRDGNRHVKPYVAMLGLALEQAQREAECVHVAVTAGRSGMGALAALATNLYGADFLWHLWVRPDIEENGRVDKLRTLTDPKKMIRNVLLNPTVEVDASELVQLPFVDLRPLHPVLWEYVRTGALPQEAAPLATLFAHTGVKRLADVFPAGLTFADADAIVALKTEYVQATPDRRLAIMVELGEILHRAGVTTATEKEQLLSLVNGAAAPKALFELAEKSKDRLGFWDWLKQHKDSLEAFASVSEVIFKVADLFFKDRGYIS